MPAQEDEPIDTYVSYADEIDVKEGRRKRTDDDGDDDSSGGNAGDQGGAAQMAAQPVDPEAEEATKQSWLEKLKLIFIAPFSQIIPGTVSYTAESDLSKKAFFLRVGLYNRQIEPTDIADPDLIQKLEDRHQERRAKYGLGSSLSLEYLKPKPRGMAAAGPGLGAADSATGDTGGGSGTQVTATAGEPTEAAKEKSIFRKSTSEERQLMAEGASLAEAKEKLDEYDTAEELERKIEQEGAFGVVTVSTSGMERMEAFNILAKQTAETIQAIALEQNLRLNKDAKDDRHSGVGGPHLPIPEQR
jgi:hypothetical protein